MRVAIYARVSTDCQNPDMQLNELREYVKNRKWEAVEFTDVGFSGSFESRPELNKLMIACKQRHVDAVLVWKLDRFGRSLKHLVNSLAELEALGIVFISLRDNLDLSTPSGRLMFHIIAAMSEFERNLIKERVKAGMKLAKSKGVHFGRRKTELDLSLINELRSQGLTWRSIAKQENTSVATIFRQLAS